MAEEVAEVQTSEAPHIETPTSHLNSSSYHQCRSFVEQMATERLKDILSHVTTSTNPLDKM